MRTGYRGSLDHRGRLTVPSVKKIYKAEMFIGKTHVRRGRLPRVSRPSRPSDFTLGKNFYKGEMFIGKPHVRRRQASYRGSFDHRGRLTIPSEFFFFTRLKCSSGSRTLDAGKLLRVSRPSRPSDYTLGKKKFTRLKWSSGSCTLDEAGYRGSLDHRSRLTVPSVKKNLQG